MLLEVDGLKVTFATRHGDVEAVRHVSFSLAKGERLGIVGESGSGKSVSSYAVMRILDQGGRLDDGTVMFDGIDLRAATASQMRDLRGREMSMVFQNPRAALNPIRKVGHQIEDVLHRHARVASPQLKHAAVEALRAVRIVEPEKRYHSYPFELSGGMCQRIVIALALACDPRLLIADEPTTGLDVTTQKAVMDLVADLTRERGLSSILITHDLGLASNYCDRLIVMKDGEVVEEGEPVSLFAAPSHEYTRRLVRSTPRPGVRISELLVPPGPELTRAPIGAPVLEVSGVSKRFGRGPTAVQAVDNVSFILREGETLGLVGESGSGKSTLSSIIARLLDADHGEVRLDGENLTDVLATKFPKDRRRGRLQMVFQDATDSLNPRFSARATIGESVRRLTNEDPDSRVAELSAEVGLPVALLDRLPHQLSGGQKARVGIARALASRPRVLILDEPTAALDVSIQAVVLNLLARLRAELNVSFLFVSHDLHVVRLLCDRVIVMRGGAIVEEGETATVLQAPQHPYTQLLLDAVPTPPMQQLACATVNPARAIAVEA